MTNTKDPQSGWVWLTISGMGPGATRGAWVGRVMGDWSELSAAVELRRRFPGITDNAAAREQARRIAAWTRCHHAQHGAGRTRQTPRHGSLTLSDVAAKTGLAVRCSRREGRAVSGGNPDRAARISMTCLRAA
jgi:hypothetical protein